MPDTGEALKIWQALRPMVDKEIEEQTENCVRAKKMIVKQATVQNEDGSVSLGVAEPYNDKVMIPSGDELSNVNPGSPVWVYWYFNNASTMHVALNGDGTQGSAVTDKLTELLNKEIADREKADRELQSYIDNTASHLRVEFNDGLNSLRSYVELTASALRLEFHDDLNGLRSYLEMTASHLRIEFYDDLNGLRSYLEMTASHLRAEFYDDMNSLRSYLELTASHLRAEFYDDMNSLRSYLELTASHLRAEFYDDVNSLRSYLELTASHLRTEFYDDVNSLRSYVEITASHLRADYYNDMASLRSYIEIQAGLIAMNVAATDENSSILRQAGLYINDQGVLVYADDNANMWQSKLNTQADRISLVVSGTGANASIKAAEIVAAINQSGSSVTISADHILLDGQAVATSLVGYNVNVAQLEASNLEVLGGMTVDQSITCDQVITNAVTIDGEDASNAIVNFGSATSSGGSITIPTTTLGGTAGPSINFNIADTQFYIDGVAAAAANVDFSSESLWSSGDKTLTLSNGKTHTVSIPNASSWSSAQIGDKSYAVTALVGGKALNTTIDTTGSYNAGAASVSSRTATSAGSVTLSSSDIGSSVSKTTTVTYDDSTSTPSVPITINASAVYSAGRNSVTIANSDIVRDGSDYYNSSTHNTTIYIEATASNGASGTQSFVVSGANAYADGQASVSQRSAEYIAAGTNLTLDSTGKILSGTGTVFYDNGDNTSGVTLEVNASKAYNAGWIDGYNAAVTASGKSGDTITIPTTTTTQGTTPTTSYTAHTRVNDTHYISFPESIALVPGQTFTGAAGNYVYKNSVELKGTAVGAVYWT